VNDDASVSEPTETTPTKATADDVQAAAPPRAHDTLVVEDLLVAEISIDGMCGVY
jgi:mycofactocin precursor